MKVLADAFAQVERFAHVDDRAEAVFMQIHAGLVGHGAEFFADMIRNRHALKFPANRQQRNVIL
jgi:hypothetical protein